MLSLLTVLTGVFFGPQGLIGLVFAFIITTAVTMFNGIIVGHSLENARIYNSSKKSTEYKKHPTLKLRIKSSTPTFTAKS